MLKKIKKNQKKILQKSRNGSVASDTQKGVCGIAFALIPKNGLKYKYDTHVSHTYWDMRRLFWTTHQKNTIQRLFKAYGFLAVFAVVTWQQWENGPDAITHRRPWLANVIAVFFHKQKATKRRQRSTIYILRIMLFTSLTSLTSLTLCLTLTMLFLFRNNNNNIYTQ